MKRFLALGLTLALLFSLSACQSAPERAPQDASRSAVSDQVPDGSASTDPADASQAPADVSELLKQGLDGSGSASAAAPAPVEEPEEVTERAPRTFGLSMPKYPTLAQSAAAKALQERIEAMGDSLIVAEESKTPEEQQTQLDALAEQHVAAIFLCPVDSAAMEESVSALARRKVPVFGFGNWEVIPEELTSLVRSDEYNAGYVCGMDLADRCPDGGDVLMLEMTTSDAMMERAQGFMDAAEESGVDLEIVDELEVEGDANSTEATVKQALREYSGLAGIFAASDRDAAGALKAVAGTKCLVYGGDGSPDLKALLSGSENLAGLGAQSPKGIAKVLVESANNHLDTEAVDVEQVVGTFLITAENVEKYGVDGWQ